MIYHYQLQFMFSQIQIPISTQKKPKKTMKTTTTTTPSHSQQKTSSSLLSSNNQAISSLILPWHYNSLSLGIYTFFSTDFDTRNDGFHAFQKTSCLARRRKVLCRVRLLSLGMRVPVYNSLLSLYF